MSLEKLLYRFLLDSPGTLLNSGESIGIGVLGMGDMGGDVDIGDNDDDWHPDDDDEGKKDEDEFVDQGERGVEEQVESESFLGLLWHWMVSLTGSGLLLVPLSMLSNDWQHWSGHCVPVSVWGRPGLTRSYQGPGQSQAASQAASP